MLEDWLVRLVDRARQTRQLQSFVNSFLDVAAKFEESDSKLLLEVNNVTSLVVSNPEVSECQAYIYFAFT